MRAAEGGLEIGALVAAGRYEVRDLTLEGAAYVDYRVHDREVEVEVALWRMDPVLYEDEEQSAALEQAVAEMRSVVHANLRRLFDVGRAEDGVPYVTLPVGSSGGIALRLGSGRPASEVDIVRYATAMAEGLEAVHAAGQVHGRLVPADLVEVAGLIKVSGAGLYGALARVPALAAERWGESRRYLAPEVLATGTGDRRSDVYSMAAILCELASGVSRPDLAEATQQLATEQLPLADLLARALSPLPERRPSRPAELVERIQRLFVDERVPTMKRPVLITPEARGTEKSPALSAEEDDEPDGIDEEMEGHTVEESSPLFLHPSAVPRPPMFGPNPSSSMAESAPQGSPPPLRVRPPPLPLPAPPSRPESSPPVVPPPPPLVPPLYSRREPEAELVAAAPVMPAIERPEVQPAPSSPFDPLPPAAASGPVGRYTLPRPIGRVPFGPGRRRILILVGLSAVVALAGVGLVFAIRACSGHGEPPRQPETAPPPGRGVAAAPAPTSPPASSPAAAASAPGSSASTPAQSAPAPGAAGSAPAASAPAPGTASSPPGTGSSAPGTSASAPATGSSAPGTAASAPAASTAPAVPAPASEPCADGMALVARDLLHAAREPFCVDRHEWPGPGQTPQVGISAAEARAACQTRSARLCSPAEWEDACRGQDGASFPYGRKYVDGKCNARGTQLAPTGAFPDCLSASGAFDMSGNAAEWDAGGNVRGASATDGTRGRCSEPRLYGRPLERARDRADIGFRCCAVPLAKVRPTR